MYETLTTAPAPTPKPTINVQRPSLVAGQGFTTTWNTTDATSLTHVCTSSGTGYTVNESLAVNGSRTLMAQSGWVGNPSSCTWTASGAGGSATYSETMTTVSVTNGSVTYIHTDGLGSPVARTDALGNPISRTRYEPYGYVASGDQPTIGFTGHVNDGDTGLTYMQQRYYDPVAGRFLSIDPVVTDANTGGSFNRYVYTKNNPYKYIDPDGREEKKIDGKMYESREMARPKDLVNHELFLNSAGKAECVELVKQTIGGNESSITWRKGEPVTANTPAGTAIANFNKDGKFDTKDTGQHAAILTESTKKDGSIKVVDQWSSMKDKGQKVHERTILKVSPTQPTPSNNAKDFNVILFEKH